jgi:hypothetical protein
MLECNEWKTQKRHECTNIAKVQTTRFMMATVGDGGTLAAFTNFKGRLIFCWTGYKNVTK